MFPGVQQHMGMTNKMPGDSDEVEADDSFLPPIDSRWSTTSEVNEETELTDNDDDTTHVGVHSRKHGDKKLSKSGRVIINKSSMSDSFVLPNIANYSSPEGIRKSRTAGSNWSHGGSHYRSRNGMPISKSCPILKNRNGYQWGKDSSEDDDDDDDFGGEYLSMSFNVAALQSNRDEPFHHTDPEKTTRLAKMETNKKSKKNVSKPSNPSSKSVLPGSTKLPDIFLNDRSPRAHKDDNNNGASDRQKSRKDPAQRKLAKSDADSAGGQEMDYELDVSPWRGDQNPGQHQRDKDANVAGTSGKDPTEVGKSDLNKPKAKRKAGNQRPPVTAKNPDSRCREWLEDSHRWYFRDKLESCMHLSTHVR